MPAPDHRPLSLPDAGMQSRPALPLQGLTLLAVEDSRFASEALRLLCQRSGARLRRAETLEAAARHLAVYRPDVVIVDLGLADGDGTDLIRGLCRDGCRGPVVLGTSGDPAGRGAAIAAGAAGFLDKPLDNLANFQAAILRHLPGQSALPSLIPDAPPLRPDTLALHDDLAHAALLLRAATDTPARRYVAGFLGSVAQSARDEGLAQAARHAADAATGLPRLAALVSARLATADPAFARNCRPQAELAIPLPPAPG